MPIVKSADGFLLLDTHVWIWLLLGDRRLKNPKLLKPINRAAAESRLKVSMMSVWELGMLESKGRIRLQQDPMQWVRRALSQPGISLAPLTEEIAMQSTRLPGEFHGDPVDRILVATALNLKAALLTADQRILTYCKHHAPDTIAV